MKKNNISYFDLKLFKKVMLYAKPYIKTYYVVLVSAILLSLFSTLNPYLLKITVDDYITPRNYTGLMTFVFLMLTVLLLEVIFQYIFVFYANWLGQMVIKDIRVSLFKKLVSFKMMFFDKSAVGRLVTRSVSDIESIANIFSQGLFMILADFLKMGIVIIVMVMINFELSLVVFSILPIIIYATRVFQKSMKKAFEQVRVEISNINTFLQERITGMRIVQFFNRENKELEVFKLINERHKKAWLKTVWYNSIFFPIAELSTSITLGLLVWYGGLRAYSDDHFTLGVLFLFIQLSQNLFRPLRQIADKFNTLQMGMVAADRVFEILEKEEPIDSSLIELPDNLKGEIVIEDLNFSYESGQEVLKNINISVKAGEKVALVGSTGSGKSTLINLILLLYEYKKGDIKLDGISINKILRNNLRSQIANVSQDIFLFADSIFNNVTLYNPNISLVDVEKAASEIGIDKFIKKLPNGFLHIVNEGGTILSSGQRQLISFLRAYVLNPKILILDEATSSVDHFTEELIQIAIDRIIKNKTSIIIAHRLTTIKKADKIIVLERGEIVETGTHSELIKIEHGHYKKLHELQFSKEKMS
ncbi:MAG: ABC transporter ATP-binding protein [Flavobacteriaceae bacterium]|nr:antibiotic ABC transporter ATP-binding protein [Flavobacteriaceae bacterium]|tara:strand:- start:6641 stop:8407 length:1767 start_codon:yes stop_codon:yes gene_type:complete